MQILQELHLLLKDTYTKLCLTTRPQLQFLHCDYVESDGDGLTINLPVKAVANSGQTAFDVRLELETSEDYILLTEKLPVIDRFPADAETRFFTFRIRPRNLASEDLVLQGRLSYKCITKVQFREKSRYRRNEGYQEVSERISLPYQNIDIAIIKEDRPPINMEHIEMFENRVVEYTEKTREILQNREDTICEVIRSLTEVSDAEGGRSLCQKTRWVALHGQWRVGKSTVLHAVEKRLKEEYPEAVILYLECPEVHTNVVEQNYSDDLALKIYQELRMKVRRDAEMKEVFTLVNQDPDFGFQHQSVTWDNLRDFLTVFSEELQNKRQGARIVLLLDEFTRIYQAILHNRIGSGFLSGWLEYFEKSGTFLLAAGAKGKRYALPNAEIMIHQPSAGTQGQITDMAIHLKRLETIKARMNRILAEKTGKSVEEVTAACERDNFMSAAEAKEWGIIDEVLG